MFKIFVLLAMAVLLIGCGDLGLDLTDAIKVQEEVNADNPDANAAFECITETDTQYWSGDTPDTIEVTLEIDCLAKIAESKLPSEEIEEEEEEVDE